MPPKEDQGSYSTPPLGSLANACDQCDLERPACGNCAKLGRQCEGYERYPIFLNRTVEGISRRSHLQEAKEAPAFSTYDDVRLAPDDVSHGGGFHSNLFREISGHSAWEVRVVAWFWDSYAPTTAATEKSKSTSVWLYHAVELSNPTPVLHQALLALSITRYGRVHGNLAMRKHGQAIYGNALRLLQQALYNEVLMYDDETLASVRALVLYELFESTSNDPTAWYRHLAGMTSLMQSRGPRRHSSALARTVLEDIRYALMLKALMLRKVSLFGQDDWLNAPWQDRSKSAEQQVYDLGFHLADLLDRADQLSEAFRDRKSLDEIMDLLEACNGLQHRMEDLFTSLFKTFLQERSYAWSRSQFEKVPDVHALTTADTNHIMIVINLWACQLLLGFVAEVLSGRLIDALDSHLVPAAGRDSVTTLCNISAVYTNQHAISDLAHAILRYLPLCVNSGASEFAASRTLFPLTCILWHFRHFEAQFRQAIALMRQMSGARNVRFAGGYSVIELIPYIVRDDGGLLAPAPGPQNGA